MLPGPAARDRSVLCAPWLPPPRHPPGCSPGPTPDSPGQDPGPLPGSPLPPSCPKKINTSDTVRGQSSLVRCPGLINEQKRKLEGSASTHAVTRHQRACSLSQGLPTCCAVRPPHTPPPPLKREVGWKNIVPKGVMIKLFLSEACATSFPISNPNKINLVAAIAKRRAPHTPEITHSPPPLFPSLSQR